MWLTRTEGVGVGVGGVKCVKCDKCVEWPQSGLHDTVKPRFTPGFGGTTAVNQGLR